MDSHWTDLRRQIIDFCLNVCQVVEKNPRKILICDLEDGWYCSICFKKICFNPAGSSLCTKECDTKNGTLIIIEENKKMLSKDKIIHYYGIDITKFNDLFQKFGIVIQPTIHKFTYVSEYRKSESIKLNMFSLEIEKNPVLEFLTMDVSDRDAKDLLFILNQTHVELIDLFIKNSFMKQNDGKILNNRASIH